MASIHYKQFRFNYLWNTYNHIYRSKSNATVAWNMHMYGPWIFFSVSNCSLITLPYNSFPFFFNQWDHLISYETICSGHRHTTVLQYLFIMYIIQTNLSLAWICIDMYIIVYIHILHVFSICSFQNIWGTWRQTHFYQSLIIFFLTLKLLKVLTF